MKKISTLGLDLGTNSLGWALIGTDGEPGAEGEGRIIDIGTRIFSASEMAGRDAKSKESLAVGRRQARTMRRQRDRRLKRKARLLAQLTEYGLMPADKDARARLVRETGDGRGGKLDGGVHALRAKALDDKIAPYELGRILFQMSQRRGFKSNRKTDGKDNEAGKIAIGVARLEQAMGVENARTYGEFLHKRRLAGKSVRTRLRPETAAEFEPDPDAKGDGYDFYPDRSLLKKELKKIFDAQAPHHPAILTDERIAELRKTILFQRELLPPKVGKCSYNPDEERLPKAHPLFQEFRLYKEVNELALIGTDKIAVKLTPEQRDILVLKLRGAKSATFPSLRKLLKLGPEFRFNKESENRKGLEGNVVAAALSHKDCFGPNWSTLGLERQSEIVEKLRETADPKVLRDWLGDNCGLDEARAEAVMKVHLPDGYGRLGPSALANLLDALKTETDADGRVVPEAVAAKRVYDRTNSEDDPNREAVKYLPKYQEVLTRHIPPGEGSQNNPPNADDPSYDRHMGKITNPTVHIALNQLRRVVNALIKKHGRPDRIAIELGRDLKLTDKQRDEVNRLIGKNTREAIARSQKLQELGQPDTGYNRLRLKLWEELNPDQPLNRVCVYTGEAIPIHEVFSAEVDVDHILPYSRTLDDGIANKLLCKTRANRVKRNRAPAEVGEWDDIYDEILARAGNLPKNKQWRFARNAMDRFADEEGFAARQLTDMQYTSRMALSYLAALYPAEEADIDGVLRRHNRVRALPGRMTEMLRRKWGLNEILHDHDHSDTTKPKNRKDHRHHAIDAFVIACTSRSLIQKIASSAEEIEAEGTEKVLANVPDPWPGFRAELREKVRASTVSHKPDHGTVSRKGYAQGRGQTAAKLHNDTAYGWTEERDEKGQPLFVRRIALSDLKPKNIDDIRDRRLREELWEATRYAEGDKAFTAALRDFSMKEWLGGAPNPFKGLRHVRVLQAENPIWIRDKEGKPLKGYLEGGNYRFDVWQLPDGKWDADVISNFAAHQPGYVSPIRKKYPTAKKVLSLMANDMVAYEDPETGMRVIARVRKFDQRNKQLYLDAHNEAGKLDERHKDPKDRFRNFSKRPNALKAIGIRQVRVDEIGQVFDPGPRDGAP